MLENKENNLSILDILLSTGGGIREFYKHIMVNDEDNQCQFDPIKMRL